MGLALNSSRVSSAAARAAALFDRVLAKDIHSGTPSGVPAPKRDEKIGAGDQLEGGFDVLSLAHNGSPTGDPARAP